LLAGDALVVLVATALGAFAQRWAATDTSLAMSQLATLLQMAAAGAAAVVALLGLVTARLRQDDARSIAFASAWAFYALLVMPLAAVQTAGHGGVVVNAGALAAALAFLGLLAGALIRVRHQWLTGLRGLGLAVLATAAVMTIANWLLGPAASVLASPLPGVMVTAGWLVLATGFILTGLGRRDPSRWRVGFGLAVVTAAQLVHLLPGNSVGQFQTLRLVGLFILIAALARHVRHTFRPLGAARIAAAEQASTLADTHARRDHEMRNAIANLAAVPSLMTAHQPAGQDAVHMMRVELARLGNLLDQRPPEEDSASVEPILTRLTTLRRAAGMSITLNCPTGLDAAIPSDVLAQVVTNLLANCARHAPGSPVGIHAVRERETCSITIADNGPGLHATTNGGGTTGSGLGLALTTRLLAAHNGRLLLTPTAQDDTGCTARLEIPLASASHRMVPNPVRGQWERAAS
jgi:two-component system OmpR family sensor kinase